MKRASLVCALLVFLLFITGCQTKQAEEEKEITPLQAERVEELYNLSRQFTQLLNENEIDGAMGMMDKAMSKAMDGKLESVWSQLSGSLGAYIKTGNYVGMASGDYEALEMTLIFENGSTIQRVVFDRKNRIAGLWYRNGEEVKSEQTLPKNVIETDVTVDAGDGYPLAGKLTIPKDVAPIAAIVLVHGSGPCDMNETVGINAPFRDLSYSLAEKGIAVLRYDKRTYTHGTAIAENLESSQITIDEEVVIDALAAVDLLKSCDGINKDRIYLLGHSMGGGLLSYINSMGADCAGYIVMAGTPRKLWELSAEQIILAADELQQSGDSDKATELREYVEIETNKAKNLFNLSSNETVFGIPTTYHKKLEQIDPVALHLNDKLPILILQGEKDRQVTMTDYKLWQYGLTNHPKATYISYPQLNHLFGEYIGEPVAFSKMVQVEYGQKTPVSVDVINDIADWLIK